MFKGGNGKTASTTNSPDRLNRIVEGTSIKGDIITDANFRLDGTLEGTINSTGKIVIGVSGKVIGDIICANADIEGEVVGNVKVDGLLTVKASAKISGNVSTGKIGMEVGSQFDGSFKMSDAPVEVTNSFVNETEAENEEELVY